jgi:hypothetical protein
VCACIVDNYNQFLSMCAQWVRHIYTHWSETIFVTVCLSFSTTSLLSHLINFRLFDVTARTLIISVFMLNFMQWTSSLRFGWSVGFLHHVVIECFDILEERTDLIQGDWFGSSIWKWWINEFVHLKQFTHPEGGGRTFFWNIRTFDFYMYMCKRLSLFEQQLPWKSENMLPKS